MAEHDTIREAVAVFTDAEAFEAAIEDLESAGFDRAEISLLASPEAIDDKLGHRYEKVRSLGDDPDTPRAAYVETESVGSGEGSLIGGLTYVPAVTAAGAVVTSGGALAAAVAAAVGFGGAGAALGTALASWLGRQHADNIQAQLERGGLLLWVRTRDAEHEQRALAILSRHGGADAHVHDVPAPARSGSIPASARTAQASDSNK